MSEAPQTQGTPAPKTSGMAIAALICGLLGISCVPFIPSVIAIALGHTSRSDIKKSNGAKTGSGVALGGLILGYLGVLVMVGMIGLAIALPAFVRMHPRAYEANDMSNLKQLYTGLIMYSSDNDTMFPPDLATLVEADVLPAGRLFKHPADKSDPPTTAAEIRGGNCGYVYTAGGVRLVDIKEPDRTILIYSLPRSMHMATCVVTADGFVQNVAGEDIESILEMNDLKLPERKKPDKPDEPAQ